MKYLLSEEEYSTLASKEAKVRAELKEIIQNLCTQVCDNLPVTWGWGNYGDITDPKPWGCIRTKDYEWYCDKCPVEKMCPGNKHWSK